MQAPATPAPGRRPSRRSSVSDRAPSTSISICAQGAIRPGRRRPAARTAGGPWSTRRPCRSCAGRRRPARPRARRRSGRWPAVASPSRVSPTPSLTRRVESIVSTRSAWACAGDVHHAGREAVDHHHERRRVHVGHQLGGAVLGDVPRCRAAPPRRCPAAALLLLVRAGVLDQQPRGRVREERRRRERVAQLLGKHHELDQAQVLAAVVLGDVDPGPAELGELGHARGRTRRPRRGGAASRA